MLHLAIECSAQAGSVAILQQQAVIAESLLPPHVGSVVSMAPTIAELLAQYGAGSSAQVELIRMLLLIKTPPNTEYRRAEFIRFRSVDVNQHM